MSNLTEGIFAHAVALHQAGRLRSTIYAFKKVVYILNMDKTVLLRFELPVSEGFDNPIGFIANDYDSSDFYEEDGQIVFTIEAGGFERKKYCKTPGKTFDEVDKLFKSYSVKSHTNEVLITKEALPNFNESLSHIEFESDGNRIIITMRDIYSGVVNIMKRSESGDGLLGLSPDTIKGSFGPAGMRTNDFLALFSFNESVTVKFPTKPSIDYFAISGPAFNMTGIISACLYDEMGTVEKGENGGREKQKNRRSKQKATSKITSGRSRG